MKRSAFSRDQRRSAKEYVDKQLAVMGLVGKKALLHKRYAKLLRDILECIPHHLRGKPATERSKP